MSEKARKRIRLQLMWDRLIAVVEEQAQAILKTAFGSVVREAGDLSTGIYDLQGRMLAQAVTGTPGHVNTMAKAARLGQSVLQVLSQPARYPLTAKTTIVAPRLIHSRPVVPFCMLAKPVRIFKFGEFPPKAHLLIP